jgi:KaiC/GvpD/RAD55 family RecA-like ATPase
MAEQKKENKIDEELFELLSPQRAIMLKIQKTFEELPEKFVILFVERQAEYPAINMELVKYFLGRGIQGIYVSINRSAGDVADTLKKEGADESKVIFIDAVSRMANEKEIGKENYIYVDSPKDLVEMSVSIEEAAEKIKGKEKFIIIDSITTLLIYNKPVSIEKFVHSISGKMHSWGTKGIFTAMESTKKSQMNLLAQFFDQVIKS